MDDIKGQWLTIRHFEQGEDGEINVPSWNEAISYLPSRKVDRCTAQMLAKQRHLAKTGKLRSPDSFRTEGKLPSGKNFYAIRACNNIRAYGWFSDKFRGIFVISHYTYKRKQKLAKSDSERVCRNWRQFEGVNNG